MNQPSQNLNPSRPNTSKTCSFPCNQQQQLKPLRPQRSSLEPVPTLLPSRSMNTYGEIHKQLVNPKAMNKRLLQMYFNNLHQLF